VLGTLSAARAAVKRFWDSLSTECGQVCGNDVHRSWMFCGPKSGSDPSPAGAMWKPVRQWSHLICLAIYVDSQVLIQSLLPTLLARFQRRTYPLVSVGLHGLLPIQTASKL